MKAVCPRCGLPGTVITRRQGERVYYYVRHRIDGRIVEHYAGPDVYVYVSKLHEDLGLYLRGLLDNRRLVDYMDALVYRVAKLAEELGSLGSLSGGKGKDDNEEELKALLETLKDKIPVWIEKLTQAIEKLHKTPPQARA